MPLIGEPPCPGAILVGIWAPRPARGWAVLSGAPEPLNPGSIFVICPPEFFLCGNLETSLGGCAGRGGGCGVGRRGVGCWGLRWTRLVGWCGVLGGRCWGLRWTRLVGWCGVPWGWALGVVGGAVGGVVWGAVGVGAGSCCEPHRASHLGRLVGWCGVSWGWVLGAAMQLRSIPSGAAPKPPLGIQLMYLPILAGMQVSPNY